MLTKKSVVTASQDNISCDLSGEVVLFSLRKGEYFGLNSVASYVWSQLQTPKTVSGVLACILQEYSVEPESCERDLLALLQEMERVGLIEVEDGGVA